MTLDELISEINSKIMITQLATYRTISGVGIEVRVPSSDPTKCHCSLLPIDKECWSRFACYMASLSGTDPF